MIPSCGVLFCEPSRLTSPMFTPQSLTSSRSSLCVSTEDLLWEQIISQQKFQVWLYLVLFGSDHKSSERKWEFVPSGRALPPALCRDGEASNLPFPGFAPASTHPVPLTFCFTFFVCLCPLVFSQLCLICGMQAVTSVVSVPSRYPLYKAHLTRRVTGRSQWKVQRCLHHREMESSNKGDSF